MRSGLPSPLRAFFHAERGLPYYEGAIFSSPKALLPDFPVLISLLEPTG